MKTYAKFVIASLVSLGLTFGGGTAYAKSALEIDASVDTALELFEREVFGAKEMLTKAKGILVLPRIFKAGIGFGGAYGTGALRIEEETVDYYNIIMGSFGFQLGAQMQNVYLLFMEEAALKNFQQSDGWQIGVDGSVALIKIGAAASVDTTKTNEPILAFVLGQKGLMYNLNIEGAKFNKIKPD